MSKYCPQCGTENQDEARFCFSCGTAIPAAPPPPSSIPEEPATDAAGPAGAGWRPSGAPSTTPSEPPSAQAQPQPDPAPRRTKPPRRVSRGAIAGEVRGFNERAEAVGDKLLTVWSFRLERYDKAGNRLPPVAVQMSGMRFSGSINEGEWVEVAGKWREGQVMRVQEVRNLTTNTVVKARKASKASTVIGWMFTILIFAALIWLMANCNPDIGF
jgi:hypothetical protein